MKTMKNRWILPIAAFAIAIGGALASNVNKTEDAAVWGYIDAPTPCHISVACSETFGPVCKNSDKQQAFGMDKQGTSCSRELYRL